MKFYSQSGQDEWIDKILNKKENGYFVDIGAYDGVVTSNTYFLETERNWDGICIEADAAPFVDLSNSRKSTNFFCAASDYDGYINFNTPHVSENGIEVPCFKLNTLLEKAEAPSFIDYLSIDIEGHEFVVLNAIDYSKWTFGVMTVEHNLYCWGPESKNKIYDLLTQHGYKRIVEDAVSLDTDPRWYMQPYEDWYVHESILGEINL